MNQRPHYLEFSKAISGFLQYKLAEGLRQTPSMVTIVTLNSVLKI